MKLNEYPHHLENIHNSKSNSNIIVHTTPTVLVRNLQKNVDKV